MSGPAQPGPMAVHRLRLQLGLHLGLVWAVAALSELSTPPILWATSAGGVGNDYGTRVAVDPRGEVFVMGRFGLWWNHPATFGSTVLPSTGGLGLFEMKLDSSGGVLWAMNGGVPKKKSCLGRAADSSGSIYETGRFGGTTHFGPWARTSNGAGDAYLTKLGRSGQMEWIHYWGGPGDDSGNDVAIDIAGNAYVAGHFTGDISFGAHLVHSGASTNTAAFVHKISSAGTVQWAKSMGGSSKACAYSVAVDASKNVYVTGGFEGTAVFSPSISLTSAGEQDVFVMKLNETGDVQWALKAGGPGEDTGNSVDVDGAGNVYIAGIFSDTASFGARQLSSAGQGDVFVMKLGTAAQSTK
mmetsp:Transcript_89718/g.158796  ORF Transcript_89718/g.158796 Transcript_89718/m.158796 type:complete len:355 (+) Transcript_89718:25-1089(+)